MENPSVQTVKVLHYHEGKMRCSHLTCRNTPCSPSQEGRGPRCLGASAAAASVAFATVGLRAVIKHEYGRASLAGAN